MMRLGTGVTALTLAVAAVTTAVAPLARERGAPVVQVRRVPNGGLQPQATFDGAGVLHLLYFAGDPRAGDLFYVRSSDAGATFTAP